jgi:hypothetical protein
MDVKKDDMSDVSLGPRTRHGPEMDALTRHLALDLFVNPAGARFLAVQCVAKAARQPRQPLPSECLMALFDELLDTRQCAFEVDGISPETGECVFLFFSGSGAHLAPAFTLSHLIEGGRWRSIRSIAGLLRLHEEKGNVWAHTDTRGILVKLREWGFAGDALLSCFYDPLYVTVLALEHVLVDVWGVSPVYGASVTDDIARRALSYDLGAFFARKKQVRLARMFERHAHDYPGLCEAIKAYAREYCAERRRLGARLLCAWEEQEIM